MLLIAILTQYYDKANTQAILGEYMAEKKALYQSEEFISKAEFSEILKKIAEKIEKNELVFQQNGKDIPVQIPDNAKLEVSLTEKIKKNIKKMSLEIELDWDEGGKLSSGVRIA
jgi:amphi-Trp domain-containing protein